MDINEFNYRETPIKKTRQYEVHVLSPDGLNQYFDKNSYLHNFLNTPSSIYRNYLKTERGYDYPDIYNLQRPMDEGKRDVISLGKDNFNKNLYNNNTNCPLAMALVNENQNLNDIPNINHINNKNKKSNEENICLTPKGETYSHSNLSLNICSSKGNVNQEEQKNNNNNEIQDKLNFENKRNLNPIETFHTQDSLKRQKSFLTTSRYSIFGSPRNSLKKVAKSTFYNKNKYKEDYQTTYNDLKTNLDINEIGLGIKYSDTKSNSTNSNLNSGNFKSYEIPNLNYKRGSNNYRLNLIRNKIEKTLLTDQNKETNPIDPLVCIKENEDFEEINEKIIGENEKLKKYMENLEKNHEEGRKSFFPQLKELVNSNDLMTSRIKITNQKFMGDKYNPSNYLQNN